MSFFDKLKNGNFLQWLKNLFTWRKQTLIPATIDIKKDNNIDLSLDAKINNSTQINNTPTQKKLNKFEQFELEIKQSTYFKSLSEKNQLRYLNTIKKLYICLGGKIPRKQPFVLKYLSTWHTNGKIEHLANITENWTYEYSTEFERYLSKYKDRISNTVINFDTKVALDYIQQNPSLIELDIFPPRMKMSTENTISIEEEDLNQIIRPSNYKPKNDWSNYMYEIEETAEENKCLSDNEIENLFNELFSIPTNKEKTDINFKSEISSNDNLLALNDDIINIDNPKIDNGDNLDKLFEEIFGPINNNSPLSEFPNQLLNNNQNNNYQKPIN